MTRVQRQLRRALTLLEVVLALAILAGAFATLSQLVGLGMRAAGDSRDLTTAQLLAESTLSEIAAGILPTEMLNRVPVDTNPGWLVSTMIDNTPHQGILRITVIIERDSESYRSIQYQLSRWIRDPNLAIPTDDADTATNSSNSSSTTSGANNTGTGAGTGNSATGNASGGNGPAGNAAGGRGGAGGTGGTGGGASGRTGGGGAGAAGSRGGASGRTGTGGGPRP